ncbi:PilL N-terminal domain-containing protein [Pseudomonas monteilii]|uniref:PFGI-1 class ICE element type IV pilus protein PilL2 n=1 Tax=Pseudomonas TaxID=286 RepID=UPI002363C920|nr:PilL N-terminal domain-containing protein [Pseudomonas monteilii]MDD2126996.1 PilL N-terminal domain-containing protein [Pseudomonas monteilii]
MHTVSSLSYILLLAALASGCATPPPPPPVPDEVTTPAPEPEYIPVVRYGRYTLVELTPVAAQQDLLLQVVDVSIPDTLHASVGDALRHVLSRSGYQLCSGRETDALHTLPLPAAHYQLGPLQLHDALLVLAGPARTLHVDHAARRVCFSRSDEPTPATAEAGTPGDPAPTIEEPQP